MTKWTVSKLSKLTNVSVQTLHYYDRIKLLEPSGRTEKGYRVYSEADLLKLQQIIALRFFGFSLELARDLITDQGNVLSHFQNQSNALLKKSNMLLDASKSLAAIVESMQNNTSVPWETVIKTIEVYNMTKELENAWVKDIFNPDEMNDFITFAKENKNFFEKDWLYIANKIEQNVSLSPNSKEAIKIAEEFMNTTNKIFTSKYAHLRTKMYELGFGEGKGLTESRMSKQAFSWISTACHAYFEKCFKELFALIGRKDDTKLVAQWEEIFNIMYGNETARKLQVRNQLLDNPKIPQFIKNWITIHTKG